ncbi:MAG TPA: hypothetical protein VGQ81_07870 [Acidobacteriota bacterium]|nr:hypothetical protein [Acidobacteriota bacterium]
MQRQTSNNGRLTTGLLQSTIRNQNPQSAIRNPQFGKSAIRNRQLI